LSVTVGLNRLRSIVIGILTILRGNHLSWRLTALGLLATGLWLLGLCLLRGLLSTVEWITVGAGSLRCWIRSCLLRILGILLNRLLGTRLWLLGLVVSLGSLRVIPIHVRILSTVIILGLRLLLRNIGVSPIRNIRIIILYRHSRLVLRLVLWLLWLLIVRLRVLSIDELVVVWPVRIRVQTWEVGSLVIVWLRSGDIFASLLRATKLIDWFINSWLQNWGGITVWIGEAANIWSRSLSLCGSLLGAACLLRLPALLIWALLSLRLAQVLVRLVGVSLRLAGILIRLAGVPLRLHILLSSRVGIIVVWLGHLLSVFRVLISAKLLIVPGLRSLLARVLLPLILRRIGTRCPLIVRSRHGLGVGVLWLTVVLISLRCLSLGPGLTLATLAVRYVTSWWLLVEGGHAVPVHTCHAWTLRLVCGHAWHLCTLGWVLGHAWQPLLVGIPHHTRWLFSGRGILWHTLRSLIVRILHHTRGLLSGRWVLWHAWHLGTSLWEGWLPVRVWLLTTEHGRTIVVPGLALALSCCGGWVSLSECVHSDSLSDCRDKCGREDWFHLL
jgi:hypothetical protein